MLDAARNGLDLFNWQTRLAHAARFSQRIDAWTQGKAGIDAFATPAPSATEDVSAWVKRQVDTYLALSPENRNSAAYFLGDLVGGGLATTLVKKVVRTSLKTRKVALRNKRLTADQRKRITDAIGRPPGQATLDARATRLWYNATIQRLAASLPDNWNIIQKARYAHEARN